MSVTKNLKPTLVGERFIKLHWKGGRERLSLVSWVLWMLQSLKIPDRLAALDWLAFETFQGWGRMDYNFQG